MHGFAFLHTWILKVTLFLWSWQRCLPGWVLEWPQYHSWCSALQQHCWHTSSPGRKWPTTWWKPHEELDTGPWCRKCFHCSLSLVHTGVLAYDEGGLVDHNMVLWGKTEKQAINAFFMPRAMLFPTIHFYFSTDWVYLVNRRVCTSYLIRACRDLWAWGKRGKDDGGSTFWKGWRETWSQCPGSLYSSILNWMPLKQSTSTTQLLFMNRHHRKQHVQKQVIRMDISEKQYYGKVLGMNDSSQIWFWFVVSQMSSWSAD